MKRKIIKNDIEILNTKPSSLNKQYFMEYVMSNDIGGSSISFNITDMSAEDLVDTSANILIYTRDGSIFESGDLKRDSTVYTYIFDEEELKHTGEARIQLVIKFIDGSQLATQTYRILIEDGLDKKVMSTGSNVIIKSWNEITERALNDIDAYLEKENNRVENFESNQKDRFEEFSALMNLIQEDFEQSEESRRLIYEAKENERNEHEHIRQDSENIRIKSELEREISETERMSNENNRVEAESKREEAESRRQDLVNLHSTLMSFYDEKKADRNQGSYYSPTLLNLWITHTPVRVRKNNFGKVELSGSVRNGLPNTTIMILPEGLRPLYQVFLLVNSANNMVGYITIEPTGYVKIIKGEQSHISLDGISFYTD